METALDKVCRVRRGILWRRLKAEFIYIVVFFLHNQFWYFLIRPRISIKEICTKRCLICCWTGTSENQYGFHPAIPTADVLTVITHRISKAPGNKFIMRIIALDISKAFDKVWHQGLLHKISSYGISGKDLSITKFFLTGRSLKVVLNGQSLKALKIGVPKSSLLSLNPLSTLN